MKLVGRRQTPKAFELVETISQKLTNIISRLIYNKKKDEKALTNDFYNNISLGRNWTNDKIKWPCSEPCWNFDGNVRSNSNIELNKTSNFETVRGN